MHPSTLMHAYRSVSLKIPTLLKITPKFIELSFAYLLPACLVQVSYVCFLIL
jgi:hypothetical protein